MKLRRSFGVALLMVVPLACGDDSGGAPGDSSGDAETTNSVDTQGSTVAGPGTSSGPGGTSTTGVEGSGTSSESSSSTTGVSALCWDDLGVGEVETLYDGFDGGSEGIAFTSEGRLIVTTIDEGVGTLWEIGPDGEATSFAEVPYALGLAPRGDGSLVVASIGELMEPDGGVYEVSSSGRATRLAEGIDSPNFVALVPDLSLIHI